MLRTAVEGYRIYWRFPWIWLKRPDPSISLFLSPPSLLMISVYTAATVVCLTSEDWNVWIALFVRCRAYAISGRTNACCVLLLRLFSEGVRKVFAIGLSLMVSPVPLQSLENRDRSVWDHYSARCFELKVSRYECVPHFAYQYENEICNIQLQCVFSNRIRANSSIATVKSCACWIINIFLGFD